MGIITISRQFGSGGEEVAREVAEKKGYLLVNKSTIASKLQEFGIAEPDLSLFDEKEIKPDNEDSREEVERKYRQYVEVLHELLYDLAIRENLVILGRGGHILFKDFPPSLHVKITAPLKVRLQRVQRLYNLDEAAAARLINEQDRDRQEYLRNIFGVEWFDLDDYHLVLNTGKMGLEEAVSVIVEASSLQESITAFSEIELSAASGDKEEAVHVEDATGVFPDFAHPSEEEFARMLDFYQIDWLYEPETFPLEWDSEGNVTEAFTPDFYLPEQDLYVELTTQKQKLVWRKNKKVRRLKELYPEVNVKIIYGKDYRGLLQKYGIEDREERKDG